MVDNNKLKFIRDSIEKLKIVDKELISSYEEGYIGKRVYNVTLANGIVKKCEQITKNKANGDAVVIIPVTDEDNIVMIVESRPNTSNGVAIEFPAGMVDDGEMPVDAAKRELLEETGYEVEDIYELEWHYQDQGCSSAIITTYVALGCKKCNKQELDIEENIDVIEMTYDEILELVKNNDLNDANSKVAFMSYSMRKKGML